MKVSKKKKKVSLLSAEDRTARIVLYLTLAIMGVVIYSIYSFALMPVYNSLAVNCEIGLVDPLVLEIVRFCARLVDVLAVSLTGATVIYGSYRFSAKNIIGGCIIFAGLGFYKFVSSVIYNWIESQYIPVNFVGQILGALGETLLWLLPFVAAFFIVNAIIKSYKFANAGARAIVINPVIAEFIGKKSGSACLLLSAMVLSAPVLIVNAGGQLFYDLLTLQKITDPLLMLWDYVSHAVLAVVGYAASVLLISILKKCIPENE